MVWSLFLFLAIISIINLLHITYYPVIHRLTHMWIIHIVIVSDQFDSALITLLSAISSFFIVLALQQLNGNRWLVLPLLITINLSALLVVLGEFEIALALLVVVVSVFVLFGIRILKQTIAIAETLIVILCILEASALIYWLLLPLGMPSGVMALLSRLSEIETQLFYAPADLTPIAMLILLFSFPLFATINWLRRRTSKSEKDKTTTSQLNLCIDGRILLTMAIVLTTFIVSYPYLPSINPTGRQVGTDIYFYNWWLNDMEANPNQAIGFALHHISSRPLFLLMIYYLKLIFQLPTIPFLERMAVPFFCMLPASVYCFGLAAKNHTFAGLVALLSSFSINVVAGMYTAYYSNIMALSLMYFALAILLIALRRGSYLLTTSSCVLSILTIFIHPWTWAFILVALCLFVGIQELHILITSRGKALLTLRRLGPVLAFIAANIIADLLKTLILPVPSGMGLSYDIANARIGLKEFFNLSYNLYFTFRIFAGGYFNNFSAILTAIVGTWYLTQQKELSRGILVAWLSLGALPTLFVDFWLNERIFYNLPIQVLSTVGLWFWPSCSKRNTLPKMLFLLFILLNLNYALRSVANLV